jgi:prepilin-type processing-associated H-X9-DG protein
MWYRQNTRRGLTLVELLVVITILILLVAMLLPAVMKLRMLSDQQEDREQLRAIGHAWLSYAQAHSGHPVSQRTSDPYDQWIKKLQNYADITEYLVSPADPRKQDRLKFMNTNPGRYTSSFVLNPYFSSVILDPVTKKQQSCDRLSDCVSLARALAIVPVSTQSGVPGPGYIFPQNWMSPPLNQAYTRALGRFGIQPDRFTGNSNDPVPGFANYFYADGHVESLTADQISQWLTAGKNFLIPEQ